MRGTLFAALSLALLGTASAASAATFKVDHPYGGKDCAAVTAPDHAMAYLKCVQSKAPDGSMYPTRAQIRVLNLAKYDICRRGHWVTDLGTRARRYVYNHAMYIGSIALDLLPPGC